MSLALPTLDFVEIAELPGEQPQQYPAAVGFDALGRVLPEVPIQTIGVARRPSRTARPTFRRYPRNVTGTTPSRFTCTLDCQFSPPLES
jgi:hypothetical protein